MEASRHVENNEKLTGSSECPVDIKDWTKDHVRQWMLEIKVDEEDADILYKQRTNGAGLHILEKSDLQELGVSLIAIKLILHNRGLLNQKTQQQNEVVTHTSSLKPYPFSRFNAAHRYKENTTLDVTETGPKDLIQPCHEFKGFTNTTEETRMNKYTYEVIRFAAACMNSRTNGTIHFGVSDKPHGQIQGVDIPKTDEFDVQQTHAIERHFKLEKNVQAAKRCIKPPRFVEVLNADMTSSGKSVIEVDIEPSSIVCQELYFNTFEVEKLNNQDKSPKATGKKKNDSKSFFIRDGSSSRNIITSKSSKDYEKYVANMPHLSLQRKEAEEKCLLVVKNSVQGSKLCEMITGGTQSLDRSHFEKYIVVANKSHPVQLENLRFLLYMDLVAVLDFDPESAKSGLIELFKEKKTNVHLPAQYKITGIVEDIAEKLELTTKIVSWVFCNGGIGGENPSGADNWLTEKGSSVRDVVSFLCRKDVLPQKKFLVIFLLLNQESDANDPLLETFNMFLQELNGQNQILCISDNETSYTYWRDLIQGRYRVDISKRCIYELSLAEVNGTMLSLWSENRKSSRFLPCGGGRKVVLSDKVEKSLKTLSILCVNQCEGGNEDKQHHEEIFYKGGKVSWWNFYFSEQPGSMPFIKRDKFDYIVSTIIPDIGSRMRVCEFFNIFHLPGCGGTTLAMHVLWALKDKFRCAVLRDATDDYAAIAEQVVQLLTYETTEQPSRLPVLLMIDDFQDISGVKKCQLQIEEECQNISSKSPQVIIVNCMRAESREQTETTDDSVFIGNKLSENEQKLFENNLKEFKKTNMNTNTFYGFMILKTNYSSDYIQGVVKNTLKGFNRQDKHAQLFAVLVLLHVYCKNAVLSVSTCEEFLGLQTKADSKSCSVEDGFKKLSTLLTRCEVDSKINFEGVRVIHSSIAQHCLKELSASHGVTRGDITNILLTTELFYEYTLGKQKLMQDVHSMLVRRQYSDEAEDSLFSPLIQDIMKETPGMEETVLHNAAKCYRKDAVIPQLLARYYYIKKQDFTMAMDWAKKAKDLIQNSYNCDTVAQVLVRQLKHVFHEDRDGPIRADSLDRFLTFAESATEACKETQQTANKEAMTRQQRQKDYSTYNTAGHVCELQVAATVIEILQKTPPYKLRSELEGPDTRQLLDAENEPYFQVLNRHVNFLNQLKNTMKQDFVFLDNFFVNLVPFFAGKDRQKESIKHKVYKYFQQYTDLFCKVNWSELRNKNSMQPADRRSKTHECLEKNRADTYTGLLEYLYEENSASTLEEIIQQYRFILGPKTENRELRDAINFIYANVILANINPESQYLTSYQNLCKLLLDIITRPGSLSEILPLYYITILLLWQEKHRDLPTFVSQMKAAYSRELKSVSNGKRAAIHFYLGKDKGYSGLISHRDINRCLGPGEDISTQWDNEKIWRTVRNSQKLHRVQGEIRNQSIWVADVKLLVDPMFVTQLRKGSGARVSFFIGFSMNGPVALDIR